MNIIEAIKEPELFRPFLADKDGELDSWRGWINALRVVYGLPTTRSGHDLIRQCTGRDPALLPAAGFSTVLLLTGRPERKVADRGHHWCL